MPSKKIRLGTAAGAALVAVAAAACAPMPPPPPVNPFTNLTPGANGESYDPSVSDDGNLVVFTSEASNLVAGDTNGVADVFLRNRATGATTNLTAGGNGASLGGVISGDGTRVAFYSEASNLVAGDTNGTYDVFVLDLATSAVTNLSAGSTDFSGFPSISDDGDTVVFQSYGALTAGDTDGGADVYLTSGGGAAQLVTGALAGFVDQPVVSGDGASVAFQAYGDLGGTGSAPVVVRGGAAVSPAGVYSGEVSLADNGTAAFRTFSFATGVISVGGNTVSDPAGSATDPALTGPGALVAYTAGEDVVTAPATGGTRTVAVDGNGPVGEPAVSDSGAVIVVTSYATDLAADSNGIVGDIVVKG